MRRAEVANPSDIGNSSKVGDGDEISRRAVLALAEVLKAVGDTLAVLASAPMNAPAHTRPLLASPRRLAEDFGVSRSTIFVWLRSGMPSVKHGRVRLIDPHEAQAWLESHAPNATASWTAIASEEARKSALGPRSRKP